MAALLFVCANAIAQTPTLNGNFFQRLYEAYKQELQQTGDGESAPRRIPAPPLDAPPFPNADWNYGGSSTIGATSTTNYPLGGPLPTEPNANGAICSPGQIRCFAPVWSGVNYLQREFSKKNYISIRNEIFDDKRGQRTGYQSLYSEHAITFGHWLSDVITIRPELRWEHAYDAAPYDNGTRRSQLTFAMDVIWRY